MNVITSPQAVRDGDPVSVAALIFLSVLAAGAGALGAFLGLHGAPRIGIDDAVITQIYARNLSHGFGYVFNVGGERVEGSTSPLWTLLNVCVFTFKESWATRVLLTLCWVFSFLSTLVTILIATSAAKMFALSLRGTAVAAAVLLAACPGFFAWSTWSLMDVSIWILEITALSALTLQALAVDRRSRLIDWSVTGLCILIVLTRPEGILVAIGGAVGLNVGYVFKAPSAWRCVLFPAVSLCAAILVCYLGFALWQYEYFGYPFPNTYYAKISSDHIATIKDGLSYTIHGIVNMTWFGFGLLAILFLSFALYVRKSDNLSTSFRSYIPFIPVFTIGGVLIAATILEGGDHFAGLRLLQPLTPLCVSAIACAVSKILIGYRPTLLPRSLSPVVLAILALIVVSASALKYSSDIGDNLINEFKVATEGAREGAVLSALRNANGSFSIGVVGAGGLPYAFQGRAYDLEGLNWVAMAHATSRKGGPKGHQSFDPAIFYAAKPDIIPTNMVDHPTSKIYINAFAQAALKGLFTDPRFRVQYRPALIRGNGNLVGFISKTWLAAHASKEVTELSWDDVFVEGES